MPGTPRHEVQFVQVLVQATVVLFKRGFDMAQNGSDYSGPQVMAPPVDVGSRAMVAAAPVPPVTYAAPGFAPRGPEILVGGFNQTWLVNCLRRRWLMASLMGLLVGGLTAGLLMWLFPESTRVTALLEIRAEDASSPFEDTKRPVNTIEIQRQAAMHPALIKSNLVLEDALFRQDIAQLEALQGHEGDELNWIIDELKVNFAAESPLLEISYEGDESKEDMVKVVGHRAFVQGQGAQPGRTDPHGDP
jgi:hypothetical protein